MWDDSLPAYTGSFVDNIILFTLYFKVFLYYILIILGLISIVGISLLPLFGSLLAYKSIVIKFKKDKKYKHNHKKIDKQKQQEQNAYMSRLDRTLKKKKKKNRGF